jgi:hypothetical protein
MGSSVGMAIICLVGIFAVFCAARDYDWFMNHRKARLLVSIFGRTAIRVFYILVGIVLVAVGGLGLLAMLP